MKIDFQQLELFENWRSIPDWEGFYEVSDWGRVRSVARRVEYGVRGHATYSGRMIVQFKKPNGYLCVDFKREGNKKRFYVHRLVALAFIGPCPAGKEVHHIDGDRAHDTLKNLQYVNRSQNMRHAGALENRWSAKLTNDQVVEIRRLSLEGMTQKAIGQMFGVNSSTISLILTKKSWR